MATQQKIASAGHGVYKQLNAVVVSAGLMEKTVKVRIATQKWNSHIKKNFSRNAHLLVHDPASSLRTGDIIAVSAGWRTSKHVHHVVDHIIAPFGPPIEERPRVPTPAERISEKEGRKRIKDERRTLRRVDMVTEGIEGEAAEILDGVGVEPMAEQQQAQEVKASVTGTERAAVSEEVRPEEVKADEGKSDETGSPKKSWWG